MKKPILFAIIGVVVLVIIGVLFFVLVINKKEPAPKPVTYIEYSLGERYTNIKDEKKILKFALVIQYTSEELTLELDKNKTQIVNNVIQYFKTKSFEQLNLTNGMERVREDLVEIIIETTGSDNESITDVFFDAFIIQG